MTSCDHDRARSSRVWFRLLTERLPHVEDEEAYQDTGDGDVLWIRLCRACSTTLSIPVEVPDAL